MPQGSGQVNTRYHFGNLCHRWTTLTAPQQAAWVTYAANTVMPQPPYQTTFITAAEHYMRTNTIRTHVGLSVIDAAPVIFDLGTTGGLTLNLAREAGSTVYRMFWRIGSGAPWAINPNAAVIGRLAPGINRTAPTYRGPFANANVPKVFGTVPPLTGFTFFSARRGRNGQLVTARIRVCEADGRTTPETEYQAILPFP